MSDPIESGTESWLPGSQMPLWAAVHVTHAVLQIVADSVKADILHIKGPSVNPVIRAYPRDSSDADILVRPEHLGRYIEALEANGWTILSRFEEGSTFEHAANYQNPLYAYADIHRNIPGIGVAADIAFDQLWEERTEVEIAHKKCSAPSLEGQIIIQALHAARSHGNELPAGWNRANDNTQTKVRALIDVLHAEVAFAAATGDLVKFKGDPAYKLWKYWSQPGEDRLEELSARLGSTSGLAARVRLINQLVHVNRSHLTINLGRPPRRTEVLSTQLKRVRVLFIAIGRRLSQILHRT